MMTENITERIKYLIVNKLDLNIKWEEIEDDVPLFEDGLNFDSIAIMEFISLIEVEFGFKLTEEELNMELFENLQTVTHLVSSKLTEREVL